MDDPKEGAHCSKQGVSDGSFPVLVYDVGCDGRQDHADKNRSGSQHYDPVVVDAGPPENVQTYRYCGRPCCAQHVVNLELNVVRYPGHKRQSYGRSMTRRTGHKRLRGDHQSDVHQDGQDGRQRDDVEQDGQQPKHAQ